jgi:hypothetical protein
VNPKDGHRIAIDNDRKHFRIVKRRPMAEPRDHRVRAGDFGHDYSHEELAK